MTQESSTWDETCLFGLGKYLLQNQRWDVPGSILHPPLSYYLHSIPLLFADTDPRLWSYPPSAAGQPGFRGGCDVHRGQFLLSTPANRGDRLLIQSRLMMVSVATLLGWFVYSWSYSLYGKWSAILAGVLYTCCPNIIAHARLITPDIVVTSCAFITVYFLWKFLDRSRRRDAIAGGVFLGLALLSKFTGLLLLPTCLGLMGLHWIVRKQIDLVGCLLFMGIGCAALALGYGMHLEPFFAGIAFQSEHASHGHATFLLGQYSNSGWWYYFIVAFLLKTPIPMIVLLAIVTVRLLARRRETTWIDQGFLVVPAAVVFTFFSIEHQSIGLRYVLPMYPFLFVWASEAASPARLNGLRKIGLLAVLVGWYVVESWWIHPHYLAYFNEIAGGPANGYKYLVDSNLDWGQDLKGLGRYMQEHSIPQVTLSYFGSDAPQRYGISYNWLPSFVLDDPHPGLLRHLQPVTGWVAISATNLQGVYFPDPSLFAQFKTQKPEAVIGYSIFLYHLGPDPR
jgi:4-amino-4-deoxy-L-arabinose transferase-like glycosyltransferase